MSIPLNVVFVEAWIKKGEKFLLAKRSSKDDQAAGKWAVPGGKVEAKTGKSIIEHTLKREILEEVGLQIQNIRYFSSRSFIRSSGHNVVALSFMADYVSGEAKPLEDQEEVKWVTIKEAENLLDEHWSEVLKNLKNNI